MENIALSIVTPAYNRGYILDKCFSSLTKQSNHNFEWIIVDDGSSDNTKSVVDDFKKENPKFDIIYVYKKNGGKHTAMNASHPFIHGKYTLILDSDDFLTEDAVEQVIQSWKKYEKDASVGTLIFLRGDLNGNARSYGATPNIPGDYRKLKRISVSTTDCCEVFQSNLFKKYPYSVFDGERFISESELWNRLAEAGYKCVYINQIIYIGEYLGDGLTDAGRSMRIRNPLGGMLTSSYFFDKVYPLKTRIKKALLYICYGFFAKLSIPQIIKRTKGHYPLKILCLFPGYSMYRLWKKRYY